MTQFSQSVSESKTLPYKNQGKFDQVEIVWTDKDVPRIQANNYESLGFGYAHARDRLIELAGQAIAMHGGSYEQGILNGEMPAELTRDGFAYILFGTAYLQLAQWQEGAICPQVLLAHGQRDGLDSKARTCQLQLFIDKELYLMPYSAHQWESANITDKNTITRADLVS
ncbi:penicillin acylase family protein [Vibrio genomosp. F10]|uniref:penicillin acylase family protein n=1 Tax=Vibrio genomosp. F10 TaxID=723171 RepID=UPI0002F78FCB|nr:penicillin acylase family protein [Vibrio genomosp. F10]OEF00608.1 hypothetical protein A1QK_11740 [Vibrio genomosp. F10 str. 9ZD137]OEF09403.1 hypothetical protein A1QI_14530 [Vibrio genomosp. F10 str. 9ZB36]